MNHKGTVVIETEKLILRPFIDEDAQADCILYWWMFCDT